MREMRKRPEKGEEVRKQESADGGKWELETEEREDGEEREEGEEREGGAGERTLAQPSWGHWQAGDWEGRTDRVLSASRGWPSVG